MKYLLDTTFLIDYMRGRHPAVSRLRQMFEAGDVLYVTEIGVGELASGVGPEDEPAMNALLEPLEFVQPGPETAITAGRWRWEARRSGSTLSLPDALIAAAAEASDAAVLTRNLRDFALTPATVEGY